MIDLLIRYQEGFLNGALVTIELALLVWTIGLVGGSWIGWLSHRFPSVVGRVLVFISFVIASIPVIVILFWAHYPLQALLGVVVKPFITSVWVLGMVNIAVVAEIVRSALSRFPQEYIVAAKVCGLNDFSTMRHIRFPILLQQTLPSLLMSQVVVLQSTLFASLISVEELLRVSQRINATAYKPVEIYSVVAIFFIVICIPLNAVALWVKHKYTRDFSES
jgi:polar amino acid transport system permease protein